MYCVAAYFISLSLAPDPRLHDSTRRTCQTSCLPWSLLAISIYLRRYIVRAYLSTRYRTICTSVPTDIGTYLSTYFLVPTKQYQMRMASGGDDLNQKDHLNGTEHGRQGYLSPLLPNLQPNQLQPASPASRHPLPGVHGPWTMTVCHTLDSLQIPLFRHYSQLGLV